MTDRAATETEKPGEPNKAIEESNASEKPKTKAKRQYKKGGLAGKK